MHHRLFRILILPASCVLLLASNLILAQQRGAPPAGAGGQRGAAGGPVAGSPPRDSLGRADLSGMWQGGGVPGLRSDGVPYTAEAQAKAQQFSTRRNIDDPMGLCLLVGIPRIYAMPMPFKIVQLPNEVIFIHEAFRGIRIIPTDGRGHPDDHDPAYLGSSVGRWEGDTLVVDVRGFNDTTWLGYGATHHTDKLQITERITRTGPEAITYEATITDPGVFTKPWIVRTSFGLRPNERIREYECHENNLEVVKFQKLLETPELFMRPLEPQQPQQPAAPAQR